MRKIISLIIVLLLVFSSSPIQAKQAEKAKNSLEIRDIQTHYFDTTDSRMVMKAVINTLQDNGFIIQNIEDEMGYLRAKKEVKLKRTNKGRVTAYTSCFALNTTSLVLSFGLNPAAILGMVQDSMAIKNEVAPHTVIFDSNVVIEPVGKRTKVRFSVIEKELENGDGYTTVKSSPRKVVRHYESDLYNEFFNQVGKNIFLSENKI